MSAFAHCEHCGRVDAPWSRGHAPKCPEYESPEPVQTCAVCGGPARVRDVEPLAALVTWECRPCALTWTDDVRLVAEEHWDDPETDDDPPIPSKGSTAMTDTTDTTTEKTPVRLVLESAVGWLTDEQFEAVFAPGAVAEWVPDGDVAYIRVAGIKLGALRVATPDDDDQDAAAEDQGGGGGDL